MRTASWSTSRRRWRRIPGPSSRPISEPAVGPSTFTAGASEPPAGELRVEAGEPRPAAASGPPGELFPAPGIPPAEVLIPAASEPPGAPSRRWRLRLLTVTLARLVLAVSVAVLALIAGGAVTRLYISPLTDALLTLASLHLPRLLAGACLAIAPLAAALPPLLAMDLAYRLYVRAVERRAPLELAGRGAVREAARGALIGAALLSLAVAVLALLGCYRVLGVHAWTAAAPAFAVSVRAGYSEELLLRVIFLRLLEEALGSRWALAISAVLFGLLHWPNPHSTALSLVSIAGAGFVLGAAYLATRRLWFAAGLHFAWNFTQGGIFGVAISGHELAGLLDSRLSCAAALSGGAFGVEGSALSVAVCLLGGAGLFAWAARRGELRSLPRRPRD